MFGATCLGQSTSLPTSPPDADTLNKSVTFEPPEPASVFDFFRETLRQSKTSGGFILLQRNCDRENAKTVVPTVKDVPLRNALNELVLANPAFQWKIECRVVNLLPTGGEPELLRTRIAHFHAEQGSEMKIARFLDFPEVKRRAETLGLLSYEFVFGGVPPSVFLKKNVDCTNVTLRELLNLVITAAEDKNGGTPSWVYSESECNGRTYHNVQVFNVLSPPAPAAPHPKRIPDQNK
jgi:hypothetical protein